MSAMPGRRSDYLYPLTFTPPQRNGHRKPPAPTRDELPRWDGAACIGENTDLWFSDNSDDRTKALAICGHCPHTGGHGRCATFARDARNPKIVAGLWGGIDMGIAENRVKPLMCAGPGCDKAATGRRKYCSNHCYYAADRARKKAREAAAAAQKLAEWEAKVAAWRREQLDNAHGKRRARP